MKIQGKIAGVSEKQENINGIRRVEVIAMVAK